MLKFSEILGLTLNLFDKKESGLSKLFSPANLPHPNQQ